MTPHTPLSYVKALHRLETKFPLIAMSLYANVDTRVLAFVLLAI